MTNPKIAQFVRGLPSLRQLLWNREKIIADYMEALQNTIIKHDEIEIINCNTIDINPFEKKIDAGPSIDAVEACTVAIYIADILCYQKPNDQVDLPRLSEIISVFHEGFSIAYINITVSKYHAPLTIPIGYTGWFPISKTVFSKMANGQLEDRRIIRPETTLENINAAYLFNFSVVAKCKTINLPANAPQPKIGKLLMENYNLQLQSTPFKHRINNICAITASDDGIKQCRDRFQMTSTGVVNDGSGEKIWIKTF
jgi:hypothetical protein